MDLGGIIAGAMAGGGQAVQQNAQNTLEKQRQEALARLDQQFARDNLDYKYEREGEIAEQQAQADRENMILQNQIDRQNAVSDSQLRIAEDAASQATEARLDGSETNGRTLEDVMEARDRELSARIESEIDRMRVYGGMNDEEIDRAAIAREVTRQYADLYPEYSDRLMRGLPSESNNRNTRSRGDSGLTDPASVFTD